MPQNSASLCRVGNGTVTDPLLGICSPAFCFGAATDWRGHFLPGSLSHNQCTINSRVNILRLEFLFFLLELLK